MSSISPSPGLQYLSNTDRFYASKKGLEMYQMLRKGNDKFHPFKSFVELFLIGMAVGILGQKNEDQKFDELLFVMETYTNNDEFGVFPLIVKSMHPELDQSEMANMMQRYAEGGLQILFEEYRRVQKIDFQALLKLRPKLWVGPPSA